MCFFFKKQINFTECFGGFLERLKELGALMVIFSCHIWITGLIHLQMFGHRFKEDISLKSNFSVNRRSETFQRFRPLARYVLKLKHELQTAPGGSSLPLSTLLSQEKVLLSLPLSPVGTVK